MPIVTAYCRIKDGKDKSIERPQIFLKVRGKFYRTHLFLTEVYRCEGGWTGSVTHYRSVASEEAMSELKKLAEAWLKEDQSVYAIDPTGLKHCGIRFVF